MLVLLLEKFGCLTSFILYFDRLISTSYPRITSLEYFWVRSWLLIDWADWISSWLVVWNDQRILDVISFGCDIFHVFLKLSTVVYSWNQVTTNPRFAYLGMGLDRFLGYVGHVVKNFIWIVVIRVDGLKLHHIVIILKYRLVRARIPLAKVELRFRKALIGFLLKHLVVWVGLHIDSQ